MKNFRPAFEENNVPIVFASDAKYLPYASVLLASILATISANHNYDIFLLHEGALEGVNLLEDQVCSFSNVAFRAVDVAPLWGKLDLPVHSHITRATYYRLTLASLFSEIERMIYLDIDTLVQEDLAILFATDLDGKAIGACLDLAQRLWTKESKKVYYPYFTGKGENYLSDYLELKHPQNYIQAGVLLLDLKKIRLDYTEDKFFAILTSGKALHWMDQDILNLVFNEEGFRPLELRWNFVWLERLEERLPELTLVYEKARKKPAIIHYASGAKPWFHPEGEFNLLWWKVAQKTPFTEQIQARAKEHAIHQKGLRARSSRWLADETLQGKIAREIRAWLRNR